MQAEPAHIYNLPECDKVHYVTMGVQNKAGLTSLMSYHLPTEYDTLDMVRLVHQIEPVIVKTGI